VTLRARINVSCLAVGALAAASAVVIAWDRPRDQLIADVLLSAAFVAGIAHRFIRPLFVNRAQRAILESAQRHDVSAVRRGIVELRPLLSVAHQRVLDTYEAFTLLVEERWQEALDKMLATDRAIFARTGTEAMLDNNIAWARLHLGEAEAAIALVEQALAKVKTARARAACLGTLGAAQVAANRPNEAVATLERALAGGDATPASQATRAWWLGEAHRALGRVDEARAAYERAIRESPDTRSGRRARAQLDALPPGPYR